jgi:hypothetical protein
MDTSTRLAIAAVLAEDERWISQRRPLIEPGVDCRDIEEKIALKQRDVDRMRELLARV